MSFLNPASFHALHVVLQDSFNRFFPHFALFIVSERDPLVCTTELPDETSILSYEANVGEAAENKFQFLRCTTAHHIDNILFVCEYVAQSIYDSLRAC